VRTAARGSDPCFAKLRARPRALLALLAALALGGCQRDRAVTFPVRTAEGRPPNLLLITVDTLRANHLGTYGYERPTSPTIDALAARGVRCDFAIASAPETAPATASLLTGLHQVHTRVRFNRENLTSRVQTLAERLTSAGYTTAGFVGNGLVGADHGFDQGFGHFEPFHDKGPFRSATVDARGVDRVLAWLDGQPAPTMPWFIWIHLQDPHGPYLPKDIAWTEPYAAAYDALGPREPVPASPSNFGLNVIPLYQTLPGLSHLGDFVRRYDSEIRETDAEIGRLLAGIEAHGQTASTLVVLSADHGESLTEHGEYLQHGWFLYDTTLRVPLIFAWPGVLPAGTAIAEEVRSVDLVPTLEEIVGIARPNEGAYLDGTSFAARLVGRGTPDVRPAFAIGPRSNHQFAVREGGWKLIFTPAGRPVDPQSENKFPTNLPERYELYDTTRDPGETEDLVAREPARVAALTEKLMAFRRECSLGGLGW
jgi:arylsulfatase A-like enzyme